MFAKLQELIDKYGFIVVILFLVGLVLYGMIIVPFQNQKAIESTPYEDVTASYRIGYSCALINGGYYSLYSNTAPVITVSGETTMVEIAQAYVPVDIKITDRVYVVNSYTETTSCSIDSEQGEFSLKVVTP